MRMQWHYVDNGDSKGPVTAGDLKALAAAGGITGETLVWREGMDEWVPYEQIAATLEEDAAPDDAAAGAEAQAAAPEPGAEAEQEGAAAATVRASQAHDQLREELLAKIENKKLRATVEELGRGPYNYPTLFPKTEGMGHKGQIKARVKVLKAVEGVLPKILYQGEEVRFVTNGIYSSFGEQYFLGWLSLYINRTVFVFTNYRVIMMNTGGKHKPRQMKWQLPYDQIKKFTSGGFAGRLSFKLNDKTAYSFSSVPGYDRKFLKDYIQEMIDTIEKEDFRLPVHQSRDNLCTNCYKPVPKDTYACPDCGEEFIKPMKPALMSLCFPCLGDFYMGHHLLGFMELFGYVVIWLVLIAMLVGGGLKSVPFVLLLLAFEHGMDFALTLHMGKKGLVSVKAAWRGH